MSTAWMLGRSAGRPFLGAAAASRAVVAAVGTERSMSASTAFFDALFPTAKLRHASLFPICGVGCSSGRMGGKGQRMNQV